MAAASAQEWDAAEEPSELLELPQCVDNRKLRLLCCACVRRVFDDAGASNFASAISFAEAWCDGDFVREDWLEHRRIVGRIRKPRGRVSQIRKYMWIAEAAYASLERPTVNWQRAMQSCLEAGAYGGSGELEAAEQCRLVRDIFPNPFREFAFEPAWLEWNDGTVSKLANAIYDDRHFEDLPVLGDALEEAGCSDPLILDHCRSEAEHVRGCWVVDLMTGRDNTFRK